MVKGEGIADRYGSCTKIPRILKIKFFLSTKTGELNIFSRLYERFRIKYFFIGVKS